MRYMNPGYASWLERNTSLAVQEETGNPYANASFYLTKSKTCIYRLNLYKELYIKASLWLYSPSQTYTNCYIGVGTGYFTGAVFSNNDSYTWKAGYADYAWNISCYVNKEAVAKVNALNEVLLHFDGKNYEAIINGTSVLKTGWTNKTIDLVIYSDDGKGHWSNLIISDEPIDIREHVIELPVTLADATMAEQEDGGYSASKAGQVLQYDLDAEALIKKYGGDTLVTGIGFQAEKAYTNGDLLTKLEEYLQEEDGTEHSIGSISLPTTGGQAVLGLPTEEITLADMAGKKLGYRSS